MAQFDIEYVFGLDERGSTFSLIERVEEKDPEEATALAQGRLASASFSFDDHQGRSSTRRVIQSSKVLFCNVSRVPERPR